MFRSVRLVLGGAAILAASGLGQADAQYYGGSGFGAGGYGFGSGGFGGWGGRGAVSAVGDEERGAGAEAAGIGLANQEDAVAGSINTDTVLRYNQYLYNSRIDAQRRYNAQQMRRLNLDKAHYDARQARIRSNPNEADINNGDALNVVLDQLTDPRVMHGSGMRKVNASLSPEDIKAIPFRDETDAITLSLDKLTADEQWPAALRSDTFKPEREAYKKAIDDALAEDENGSLKPETIAKVRDAVARLYRKVADTIPKTQQPDHLQATNYLKGLAGLSKTLEKPNVEKLISELEKVKSTSIGNLIGFMHAYNLRFAAAETPKQRAVYEALYGKMANARDTVMGQPGDANKGPVAENVPPTPQQDPTAIFHGFQDTHLNSGANPQQ